jgi:DNA-binding transcriptional MerR regulator
VSDVSDETRYGVDELAELSGVSRRTVRYYIQEGLLTPPFGLGRGSHYGREHLEQLLRVKAMQEQGLALEEIRGVLSGKKPPRPMAPPPANVPRASWTRIELAPGVELHVSSTVRLPAPGKLAELVETARRYFRSEPATGGKS